MRGSCQNLRLSLSILTLLRENGPSGSNNVKIDISLS